MTRPATHQECIFYIDINTHTLYRDGAISHKTSKAKEKSHHRWSKIWETHTEENNEKSNDHKEKTIYSMKDTSNCKDQAKKSTNYHS